ncbi:MAG TPA: hypothetical protein VFH36_19440 [Acidimicrobiales bacterium]|nr:hypothetical protein [Acidimicrobiales bacterium]
MVDIETRLREAVADRSDAFVPAPDLPERALRRARQRERSRRLALVGAVASLVVVVAVAASLALRPVDDGGDQFELQPPGTTAPPRTRARRRGRRPGRRGRRRRQPCPPRTTARRRPGRSAPTPP